MKGTLRKTEQGWMVEFKNHDGMICRIPLHPTDLGVPSYVGTILGEVQEVEFEIVEQCCTPESQIKRYVDCKGCDKKQYYAKVIQDNPVTRDSTALVDKMTPKEKANQLFNEFYSTSDHPNSVFIRSFEAKKKALFVVDECINIHFNLESDRNGIGESFKYWQDVKTEIVKL